MFRFVGNFVFYFSFFPLVFFIRLDSPSEKGMAQGTTWGESQWHGLVEAAANSVLKGWTALSLAVTHQTADEDTNEIVAELRDAVLQKCLYSRKVEVNDFEDVLRDHMEQLFVGCEDGSIEQVAAVLSQIVRDARVGKTGAADKAIAAGQAERVGRGASESVESVVDPAVFAANAAAADAAAAAAAAAGGGASASAMEVEDDYGVEDGEEEENEPWTAEPEPGTEPEPAPAPDPDGWSYVGGGARRGGRRR